MSSETIAIKSKKPQATNVVFFSQVLWGFSYYAVYSLLTSFFKKGLLFSEADTIAIVAAYGAMGPLCTFIGGIVTDRILGVRRAYILGYALYSLGFLLLAFSAYLVGEHSVTASLSMSFLAVAMLSIARGTAGANNNVIITKSHQKEDKLHLLDVSYSYNYMLNNFGSTMGQIVAPLLVGASFGILWGYRVAFSICTVFILVAVLNQILHYKTLGAGGSALDERPLSFRKIILLVVYFLALFALALWIFQQDKKYFTFLAYALFVLAILYFLYLITQADPSYRPKMVIALIFFAQLIAFYVYYNQLFTSLMLYPINVMKEVQIPWLHTKLNAEFTNSFNAFWCVVGSFIVIGIVKALDKRGIQLHVGYKFVIGMSLAAISYYVFWLSTLYSIHNGNTTMSIWWMFFGHAFAAMAELFVLNLAISSLSLLVPKNMTSTTLAINLLTMGIGSLLAGKLASQIALKEGVHYEAIQVFSVYRDFFLKLAIMATIFAVIFVFTTFFMKYLEKKSALIEKTEKH